LSSKKKLITFLIVVIGGWFIRMGDPLFGVFFSIWYIGFVRKLYPKGDRQVFLGFRKLETRSIPWALACVGIFIAVFLPFYLLSSLCPMHLFDPIITRVYGLAGNSFILTILVMYPMIGTFTVYAEELFFRAFIQDALDDFVWIERGKAMMAFSRRRIATMIIANIIFGISHINLLWDNIINWATVPPDIPFIIVGVFSLAGAGVLFSILRIKFNSIWPAMIAHTVGNFFMVILPAIILLL
nr:CPBP family intramembrane metalloprotease [Candidatus Sigynarchaeota archaeon]